MIRSHARPVLLALASTLALASVSPRLLAQVSKPTDKDRQTVPMQFRPDDQKGAGMPNFSPRGTPEGFKPGTDARDFTGSYVSSGGGPPGGAPPGGAPPGGVGPAGAPPGGAPPVPAAGGPPDGGEGPPPAAGATPGQGSCTPTFGGGAYATHLVSSSTMLLVVGEENHRMRRLRLDASMPAQVVPTYSGTSVAHWDGNTLVAETRGIRGRDGQRLIERWTRLANGSIDIETTTIDATGQSRPAQHSTLVWRPDLVFVENICEDFGEAFGADYGKGGAR